MGHIFRIDPPASILVKTAVAGIVLTIQDPFEAMPRV